MANQIVPRQRSPPRSILVIPRTSEATPATESEEFSRINNNSTLYVIDENGIPKNHGGVSTTNSEQVSPGREPDYEGILDARIPTANWRPDTGSIDHRPLVEVPDNVLPSPSLIASRPPQLSCPRALGSKNSSRPSGQAHLNNPQDRFGDEQFHEIPLHERYPKRNQGSPPSPPVVNLAGAPTCIYTIYMPIMGNTLLNTTWDHLYNILQLILTLMKDHTKSASGIPPPNELYINPLHSSYEKIIIPFEINKLISGFKGTIWRSNYQIIIRIPSEKWIHYGRGEMDTKMAHQFEQSAWIQLSQFNAEDLRKAINQTIQFEEIAKDVQLWQQYHDRNQQNLITLNWFIRQEYILFLKNG